MANKAMDNTNDKTENRVTEKKKKVVPVTKKSTEVTYTVEELASATKRFGEKYEVIKAALMIFGKKEATIKETEEAIHQFRERKVK